MLSNKFLFMFLLGLAALGSNPLQRSALAQGSVPHDLKYILDKPLQAMWSRPSEHLKNPALAEFLTEMLKVPPSETARQSVAGFPKMDYFKLSLGIGHNQWSDKPRPIDVAILHYSDPAVAKSMWDIHAASLEAKTVPELKFPVYTFKQNLHHGQEEKDWKLAMGKAQPDPQTLVEGNTVEMLIKALAPPAGANESAPWAKEFPNWANSQSLVLIDLSQFRELMKALPMGGMGPMEAMIVGNLNQLLTQADYAFISIDTTDGIQIKAMAQSANAESAQRFKATLDGIVGLGKGFLPMFKQMAPQMNQELPGMGDLLTAELDNLVNALKITQDGTQTTLTWSIKQDLLVKLVKLLIPAFHQARERAIAAQNKVHLQQLGMAMQFYQQEHGHFPPAAILGKDGKTTHSWRVAMLPYIDDSGVHKEYKFDEPWDSEHNKKLIAKIPKIYRSPNASNSPGATNFTLLTNPQGVFNATPAEKGTPAAKIRDGMSQTLMLVESNTEIPWTKPEDLPIADGQALPALGFPGKKVMNVLFCDGSVHEVGLPIKAELLRALVNMADGSSLDLEELNPGAKPAPPTDTKPVPAPVP